MFNGLFLEVDSILFKIGIEKQGTDWEDKTP